MMHNIEKRTGMSLARTYPYRGWDAKGRMYWIKRPEWSRGNWQAFPRDDAECQEQRAPTLRALAARLSETR